MEQALTFSTKLKELRKQHGFTQPQFAEKLYEVTGKLFTIGTISNYETGATQPSLDLVPHIAKIFNVSIDELFDIAKEEVAALPLEKADVDVIEEVEKRLFTLEAYSNPTKEVLREAILLGEYLLKELKVVKRENVALQAKLDTINTVLDRVLKK